MRDTLHPRDYQELAFNEFIFRSRVMAPIWAVLRLWLGWEWLLAGWHKVTDDAWVGSQAGGAVAGFLQGALKKVGGEHPDVMGWWANLINTLFLPNAKLLSFLVAYGEVILGVMLILGVFTGLAAFGGAFLNSMFLLSGTVSSNPIMLISAVLLIAAWRVAGYLGLDFFLLKRFARKPVVIEEDPLEEWRRTRNK